MPAIVSLFIQGIQVGVTLTPEIVAAIKEIINMLQPNAPAPTAAQWQTLDAGLASLMAQQQVIIGQAPTSTSTSAPTA